MKHPHPDKAHVVSSVRRYLLSARLRDTKGRFRSMRTARSLIHYRELIATYLEAKREVIR